MDAITGLFSKPKLPKTPAASDPAVQDAERRQRLAAAKSNSGAGSILTGGGGDSTAPASAASKLLGQ